MITINLTAEQAKFFEDAASLLYVHGLCTKGQSIEAWKLIFNARIEAQVKEEMNQEQAS